MFWAHYKRYYRIFWFLSSIQTWDPAKFISRLHWFQHVAGGAANFSFIDYTNPNTLPEVLPNFYFEITQTPTHCKDSINMDELKEIRKREKAVKIREHRTNDHDYY